MDTITRCRLYREQNLIYNRKTCFYIWMSLKGQYLLCNGCGDDTHLLKKPVPTPHGLISKLRAIIHSRETGYHYHTPRIFINWSTETILGQFNFAEYLWVLSQLTKVLGFFSPFRLLSCLRVETSLPPSQESADWRLFARESRCSEEGVVGWQSPPFGSSLCLSCFSLIFRGEDSKALLQEVMLVSVRVVALERLICGIRGARSAPFTASVAAFTHSGGQMASCCRWLPGLVCTSL